MNTNAENVIAILLSMKILSAIWNKFITIIDLFATFAPKFSNWGEVSWFILEWYIILLVSYVFEHQIYMIWKYVDSVVRWFFSKPHKFAKMADLDLIIGRLNTIWFRELRIIRICAHPDQLGPIYRVDKKYATSSVHYQNKNFLENSFMNPNFDLSQ